MSLRHLHAIRDFELDQVLNAFPGNRNQGGAIRVLDLGAGSGRQSARMAKMGFNVIALDLHSSTYASERVYPVINYDGKSLPLADGSIDVVFSSNVLEHVSELSGMLAEIKRVLAPDGRAIHVLPTPAWRCWTTICHYPWIAIRLAQRLAKLVGIHSKTSLEKAKPTKTAQTSANYLWSARHGERGSALTEAWYFSAKWWRRAFYDAGFILEEDRPLGLFYTGDVIFSTKLSIPRRALLSEWLGSSCRVYVLRLPNSTNR